MGSMKLASGFARELSAQLVVCAQLSCLRCHLQGMSEADAKVKRLRLERPGNDLGHS